MADVILKNYYGEDVTYSGVETVSLNTSDGGKAIFTEGEKVQAVIEADFSAGDQVVQAGEGELYDQVTITKPETLMEENIRSGIEIAGIWGKYAGESIDKEVELDFSAGEDMVVQSDEEGKLLGTVTVKKPETLVAENIAKGIEIAGVVGEHIGEAEGEEINVTLDFSDGDMKISPDEGEMFSKVNIPKPETLIPENIAKDVSVAGIVGTLTGSDENESSGVYFAEETWIDDICFWDYDGELISNIPLADASTFTALPVPPTHDGLTFVGWNYTLEEIQSTEYPLDIGAVYIPADGNTHLLLDVTSASYLKVPLYYEISGSGSVSIDWGDGSTSTATSSSTTTTHTYSAIGTYEVIIAVPDGTILTLGSGTTSTSFVGGNTSTYRAYAVALYLGNNVELGVCALYYHQYLEYLTIPNGITEIPDKSLYFLSRIRFICLPSSITEIGASAFYYAGSSNYLLNTISIPASVTDMGSYLFYGSVCKRIVIPRQISNIPEYCFNNMNNAERFFIPNCVTEISQYNFCTCGKLRKITLPESLTTMGNNCLAYCYCLNTLRLPPNITTIGTYFLYRARALTEIYIPSNIESIGSNFLYDSGIQKLTIEGDTALTAISSDSNAYALYEIIYYSETAPSAIFIKKKYGNYFVPDSAYDSYQSLLGDSYSMNLKKLSEYPGELPVYE